MNYLVMISLALLLMIGVESKRDGYIVYPNNCVYHCVPPCDGLCKKNGGSSGSCSFLVPSGLACWCKDLPDNVPIKDTSRKCTR
uniref:Neurotoxin-1'' n=1 Tax=Androctonus australis TaxID=6858 RepID=SCX1_ANDAU|nr:RecName: Full=Neurotoxin-1''; AltName: Full=AaH I''; Short=AaHI''; AltName: Full=Neurotoxin I''; Contains: RecName: Full=Neurotoxin-1/1'; AltName: Full=AaH I/AaH I'; Short=AaHI/AaHI'; AltName: Full=Neurotoxin I/I'; Flags: Precursor [Androctonus australis]AAA29946.1 neurotoxin AaH I [Androctonus australis]